MRQLDPFYVDVHRLFEGCRSLGMTRVGEEAVLVAECPKGRRGVFLGGMGDKPRDVDLGRVELSCPLGKPKLRAPGDHPLDLDFVGPRDALAPLLPKELAPAGSRAAWTGSTLLIAREKDGALRVERHQCHHGVMTLLE